MFAKRVNQTCSYEGLQQMQYFGNTPCTRKSNDMGVFVLILLDYN